MADREILSHIDSNGWDMNPRLSEANYRCYSERIRGYENIQQTWVRKVRIRTVDNGSFEERIARYVVRAWYNSDGHRQAMMHPGARTIGVGVYVDEEDRVWSTLLICS